MSATLTAPSIASTPPVANDLSERLYRLDVRQYEEMTRLGILTENDKVELLEGLIVTKMTRYAPHIVATLVAFARLSAMLPEGWFATKEDPITVDKSEPEPDAAIIRGAVQDYLVRKPSATDVGLVIEVADSSLAHDRTVKKRIYARSGIPVYWIVNLNDRRVEVHEVPTGPCDTPEYQNMTIVNENETLAVILEGREIGRVAANELLP